MPVVGKPSCKTIAAANDSIPASGEESAMPRSDWFVDPEKPKATVQDVDPLSPPETVSVQDEGCPESPGVVLVSSLVSPQGPAVEISAIAKIDFIINAGIKHAFSKVANAT